MAATLSWPVATELPRIGSRLPSNPDLNDRLVDILVVGRSDAGDIRRAHSLREGVVHPQVGTLREARLPRRSVDCDIATSSRARIYPTGSQRSARGPCLTSVQDHSDR